MVGLLRSVQLWHSSVSIGFATGSVSSIELVLLHDL